MPPSASGALRRRPVARREAATVLPGVTLQAGDAALVLRFGTPPPALWTPSFTADVMRLLRQCREDARAARVVLTGPTLFDDAKEPGAPFAALLEAIAAPGTPVAAAIPGAATGAGLELALACAMRAATPAGSLGFPGILRGELPVHGGVTRLARRVSTEAALEMLAFATPVPAPLAHRLGLVDALGADPVAAALAAVPAPEAQPARTDSPRLRDMLRRRAPGEAAPRAALHALLHALSAPPQRAEAAIRETAAALRVCVQGGALAHAAQAEATCAPHGAHRLRWALLREAIHLVDEGAAPEEVDLALRRFGMRTAPLAACDRDGMEAVARDCVDPHPDAWRQYSPLLDLLIDAGRTGRAARAGWYRYDAADPRPLPDPALAPLLAESARAGRRRRHPVPEAEIVARCIAALAGEAAGLIAAGLSPLAVDGLSLRLGFPRWRGGIWHHVQATGPAAIAARLAAMPTAPPPHPLLGG